MYVVFRLNMKKKRITCSFCSISYKSKFCISLHHRLHQENPGGLVGFQCGSCKKKFEKFMRYQWHLFYHGSSRSTKPSRNLNEKNVGKFEMTRFTECIRKYTNLLIYSAKISVEI